MSFDEFYRLKNEYESNETTRKREIIKNTKLSWTEKRRKFAAMKPQCVRCKQSGGTIFTVSYVDESRTLTAKCGHHVEPCDLKMTIKCGVYEPLLNTVQSYEQSLKDVKHNIILSKNDMIFGYKLERDVMKDFDELKTDINETSQNLDMYLQDFGEIVADDKQLGPLVTSSYEHIAAIKKHVAESNLDDAVNIYIDDLLPALNTIRKLTYDDNFVWRHDDSYTLVQRQKSIKSLEHEIVEPSFAV
jgi:hypothetical protein